MEEQARSSLGLLALTAQRDLLFIRPLLKLDFTKMSFPDGEGGHLLEHVDTNYLCFEALTFMMEGAAMRSGYTLAEVREHLISTVGSMGVPAARHRSRSIADIVLETLSNASNNYIQHRCSYFHAPSAETRWLGFRLLKFEPDAEDKHRRDLLCRKCFIGRHACATGRRGALLRRH